MTLSAERVAANEQRFREVNELIDEAVAATDSSDGPIAFHCECASTTCDSSVDLTSAEFQHVRGHDLQFVVAPGHAIPEHERVVDDNHAGYWIVRKIGAAADALEQQ